VEVDAAFLVVVNGFENDPNVTPPGSVTDLETVGALKVNASPVDLISPLPWRPESDGKAPLKPSVAWFRRHL
jgi:hypothetical protein